MSEEIFRGESLTVVLRCRDRHRQPVNMEGKEVVVVMVDRRGRVVFEFNTGKEDKWKIEVDGHFLFCPLSYTDMAKLKGVYMVEIRVKEGGIVRIAQVPGVEILDSVTGDRL